VHSDGDEHNILLNIPNKVYRYPHYFRQLSILYIAIVLGHFLATTAIASPWPARFLATPVHSRIIAVTAATADSPAPPLQPLTWFMQQLHARGVTGRGKYSMNNAAALLSVRRLDNDIEQLGRLVNLLDSSGWQRMLVLRRRPPPSPRPGGQHFFVGAAAAAPISASSWLLGFFFFLASRFLRRRRLLQKNNPLTFCFVWEGASSESILTIVFNDFWH
jgi:hypothetical protein